MAATVYDTAVHIRVPFPLPVYFSML
jgi:hypothetical protein